MTAFSDDHAQEQKQGKKQWEAIRLRELERKDAVQALYKTKAGRTYLWSILELTGAFGSNPFRADPLQTAFLCGQQHIGQQLMAHMIEANPVAFTEMMKEQTNDINPDQRSFNDPVTDGGDDAADNLANRPDEDTYYN